MGKSIMTIYKEMEKEAYAKTALGQLEKKMRLLYSRIDLGKAPKLPEETLKQIDQIRNENEKWQLDYIDQTIEEDKKLNGERKEAVDNKLFESMSKEVIILENYLQKNDIQS